MTSLKSYFYFIPQTGVGTNEPPSFSNFYVYRLPVSCLARCEIEVQKANMGSAGLEYSKEFLEWLDKHDTKCRSSS